MNVGDYVRTKDGIIGKTIKEKTFMNDILIFLDSKKGNGIYQSKDGVFKVIYKEDIIKSSPQIIDLIEVGDYVNGLPVIRIYNESEKYDNSSYKFSMKVVEVKNDNYETIPFDDIFKNEEIKTIVTHEQMEAMQYRVEE